PQAGPGKTHPGGDLQDDEPLRGGEGCGEARGEGGLPDQPRAQEGDRTARKGRREIASGIASSIAEPLGAPSPSSTPDGRTHQPFRRETRADAGEALAANLGRAPGD